MPPVKTAAPARIGLDSLLARLQFAAGWAELRAALSSGHSGTIDGAWASSAALAVAALAADAPGTLLAVLPTTADLVPWVEDLTSFSGTRPAVFEAWESWPVPTHKGKLDPATSSRLRLLQELLANPPRLVVTTIAAMIQPVPERADLAKRGRKLTSGEVVDPDELAQWLVANGYKRVEAVEYPGEFGKRGGICDIYPPDANDPVRLEFFGDELESIRTFATGTQRSLEKKGAVTLLSVDGDTTKAHGQRSVGFVTDYLPPQSWVALVEPGDLKEQSKLFFERVADTTGLFVGDAAFAQLMKLPNVTVSAMPRPSVEASVHLRVESVERFSGNVRPGARRTRRCRRGRQNSQVFIACHNGGRVPIGFTQVLESRQAGRIAAPANW